jgi:hypothetical protein
MSTPPRAGAGGGEEARARLGVPPSQPGAQGPFSSHALWELAVLGFLGGGRCYAPYKGDKLNPGRAAAARAGGGRHPYGEGGGKGGQDKTAREGGAPGTGGAGGGGGAGPLAGGPLALWGRPPRWTPGARPRRLGQAAPRGQAAGPGGRPAACGARAKRQASWGVESGGEGACRPAARARPRRGGAGVVCVVAPPRSAAAVALGLLGRERGPRVGSRDCLAGRRPPGGQAARGQAVLRASAQGARRRRRRRQRAV